MYDHVKTLTAQASTARAQETRAVKVESDLRSARELVQVMSDQEDAIISKRDTLRDEVKYL